MWGGYTGTPPSDPLGTLVFFISILVGMLILEHLILGGDDD